MTEQIRIIFWETHYKENEEGDDTDISMRIKAGSAEDLNLFNF